MRSIAGVTGCVERHHPGAGIHRRPMGAFFLAAVPLCPRNYRLHSISRRPPPAINPQLRTGRP